MADVGRVVQAMTTCSSGCEAGLAAIETAGAHAKSVRAEMARAELEGIAAGVDAVVSSLNRVHGALAAQGKVLDEVTSRVAAVPPEASPTQVETALASAGRQIGDVSVETQAIVGEVQRLQGVVAEVLDGGEPEHLIAYLEAAETPLQGLVASLGTAATRTDELLAVARGAGSSAGKA